MKETLQLVCGKQKIRGTIPELQTKPPLSSKYQRPDKDEAVQQFQKYCRYMKEGQSNGRDTEA